MSPCAARTSTSRSLRRVSGRGFVTVNFDD
jgi:hypothetical protein